MGRSLLQTSPVQLVDLRAGLVEVRQLVRRTAVEAGLPPARVAEIVLAAHEVAMNALTHGRGQGAVRVWTTGSELVCEVEDRGPGISDPDSGLLPPSPTKARGRGLWIARQLSQAVEIESAGRGARVRLRVNLGRDARRRAR